MGPEVGRVIVKVGEWYTQCCWRDVSQIESEDDLQELLNDEELPVNRTWPTEEEALTALVIEEIAGADTFDDLEWYKQNKPDFYAKVMKILSTLPGGPAAC